MLASDARRDGCEEGCLEGVLLLGLSGNGHRRCTSAAKEARLASALQLRLGRVASATTQPPGGIENFRIHLTLIGELTIKPCTHTGQTHSRSRRTKGAPKLRRQAGRSDRPWTVVGRGCGLSPLPTACCCSPARSTCFARTPASSERSRSDQLACCRPASPLLPHLAGRLGSRGPLRSRSWA